MMMMIVGKYFEFYKLAVVFLTYWQTSMTIGTWNFLLIEHLMKSSWASWGIIKISVCVIKTDWRLAQFKATLIKKLDLWFIAIATTYFSSSRFYSLTFWVYKSRWKKVSLTKCNLAINCMTIQSFHLHHDDISLCQSSLWKQWRRIILKSLERKRPHSSFFFYLRVITKGFIFYFI